MNLTLVRVDPWAQKRRITLKKLPVVIGRSPDASLCIEDRWASRRHCTIEQAGNTLVVRDLGSRHGTLVNGKPVKESPLLPGDKLTVGITTFQARYRPESDDGLDASCGVPVRLDAPAQLAAPAGLNLPAGLHSPAGEASWLGRLHTVFRSWNRHHLSVGRAPART